MKYPKHLLSAVLLGTSVFAHAQLIKLPVNNAFRADVQKVMEDYPQQFATLRGGIINKNPQTVEYASLLLPDGAQESIITRYSSVQKPMYSWQAVMLTTESYEAAVKKYKWLFGQLKGLNVKYVADLYTLRGEYEVPDESRKFTVSTLALSAPPSPLRKLKVDVSMTFEFPEWKVSMLVYEKEREDDEKVSVWESDK
jgi:hypothetical protein